jgi:hypothetical protein
VQYPERASSKFLLNVALGEQRNAEASFNKALLCRQPVNRDYLRLIETGYEQPSFEKLNERLR